MSDEDTEFEIPSYSLKVADLVGIGLHVIGNVLAVLGNGFHAYSGEFAAAARLARYRDEIRAEEARFQAITQTDWHTLFTDPKEES